MAAIIKMATINSVTMVHERNTLSRPQAHPLAAGASDGPYFRFHHGTIEPVMKFRSRLDMKEAVMTDPRN